MEETGIFQDIKQIFFPKYGNADAEGWSLFLVFSAILLYVSVNSFILESLIQEIRYTENDVTPGYYFGSAIGLFIITLVPTLVTVWMPIFGQSDPHHLAYFNTNLRTIVIKNFGCHTCLLFLADLFKGNFYDNEAAIKALIVYPYSIVISLVIYFIGQMVISNSPLLTNDSKSIDTVKAVVRTLDISEALAKLEEIKRALDSGLIDESIFQEMKAKIQERIKKDI
jgi:hypothetical protein